jgi:hypothetical protein
MKKSYAGKVTNQGSQKVDALFPQKKGKGGVKKTGDDLRTKGGKK